MLIAFEGIEGSGKSTQAELLNNYLVSKGHTVVRTREPGGSPLGEALRKVLLQRDMNIFPFSELLVFMAMRAQHVDEVILPALQEQKIVLCDRFVDATYAYQGYGRSIDLGIIETLNRLVTKGIRPNLTILLDVDVETGLTRKALHATMDRFEKEALSFHQKIRDAYLKLSKEDPGRFLVVNGGLEQSAIQDIIRQKVETLINNYGIR
ncbi:MAG: dTMP kinase [Syntrophobacterales bacterium]|jgi:dTMP kinase|nr:dTMP kinase [Syntrophobacterales bacterium]